MYVETPTLESLVAAAPDVDPVQSPLLVLLAPAHMEIVPALCEAFRTLVGGLDPAMCTAPFYPDINGRFPLAMSRSGHEDVVRDPVRETPSGGVRFLSDVPENSVLHVMAATPEAMLTAASEGAVRLAERVPTGCTLMLDCGSRANALGERFVEELEHVRRGLGDLVHPDDGLLGMLVLGEIASDGEGRIELYNKTLVLAAFHD